MHRIGRTARVGREGTAVLFLENHEIGFLEYLKLKQVYLLQFLFQIYIFKQIIIKDFKENTLDQIETADIMNEINVDIIIFHSSKK